MEEVILALLMVSIFRVCWYYKYHKQRSLIGPIVGTGLGFVVVIEMISVITNLHIIAAIVLFILALVIISESVRNIGKIRHWSGLKIGD